MKKTKSIIFLCSLFIFNVAKAQSYVLKSVEGNDSKIDLYYKPASGILRVSYLNERFYISNYMTLEQVKVLNNIFLSIEYVKRAGSNQDSINLLYLYVCNGKLCQALHVNSLRTYDLRPNEYSSFKMKSVLLGTSAETYKLKLDIHDENTFKLSPKLNYGYNKTKLLAFDKNNCSFYSSYEIISGSYTLNESDASGNVKKIKRKFLKKIVPVIKIRDKYFNIDHKWYTRYKNEFYSMSLY